jgi:hypothetical protein
MHDLSGNPDQFEGTAALIVCSRPYGWPAAAGAGKKSPKLA